ncbi:major facilitator superfamily domain-containing protein [Dichomitus squalens]|nr:major facilitator superfamily domain-containing protein [Dichomitus squalens]
MVSLRTTFLNRILCWVNCALRGSHSTGQDLYGTSATSTTSLESSAEVRLVGRRPAAYRVVSQWVAPLVSDCLWLGLVSAARAASVPVWPRDRSWKRYSLVSLDIYSFALVHGFATCTKLVFRLVPFAIVASVVRGMTIAPRVQVFTQLSCNQIYGHDVYDHTSLNRTSLHLFNTFNTPSLAVNPATPSFPPLDVDFSFAHQQISSEEPTLPPDDDGDEPDPRRPPSERCLKDPAVQAGAARLQTIMTTTMGVLSALTTIWWGGFGERHGRTKVLAVATFGLFMTDLMFILVSTPHSIFAAHGHKLLIISPIIEGLCGGWATLQAATSAYVSDCTSDGSRAGIFSRFTGVFYFGFAMGPAIGAFLIRHPFIPIFSPAVGVHNGAPTVTSVFYVAALASFVNLMLALFLFPESLDKKKAKGTVSPLLAPTIPVAEERLGRIERLFNPFTLFLPKTVTGPNGSKHKDWSMMLLAMVLFGHLLSLGMFQLKYLYAEHIYGWGAETLSYYISFMGSARALHLLFVLPFVIVTFKPKKPVGVPGHPVTPAVANAALAEAMRFDKTLIGGSLFLDLLSHSLVSLSPTDYGPYSGQALFVGATTMSCFGAGLMPAVNSLALCVMQSHGDTDTGKMFGAFSLVQAIGQTILGPILFGIIYSKTVATYPKAIYVVAGSMVFASFVILLLLRPDAPIKPARRKGKRVGPGAVEARVEPPRGRSRKNKDIRQSRFSGPPSEGSLASSRVLKVPQAGQSYGATSSSSGSGSAYLTGTSYQGRST